MPLTLSDDQASALTRYLSTLCAEEIPEPLRNLSFHSGSSNTYSSPYPPPQKGTPFRSYMGRSTDASGSDASNVFSLVECPTSSALQPSDLLGHMSRLSPVYFCSQCRCPGCRSQGQSQSASPGPRIKDQLSLSPSYSPTLPPNEHSISSHQHENNTSLETGTGHDCPFSLPSPLTLDRTSPSNGNTPALDDLVDSLVQDLIPSSGRGGIKKRQ
ncbi:hypothetical protein BT96DRAFT_1000836 [Gymnopus androsaceus JB14]|uniref:Uncharacterized protein n=1 Tax=Gymnopus androsaceus JB14 TaxID=1447944 RepID=A0A6A4H145_9AGAR|nr:hypothetical protein BT96DRAFT_1000836 [Gymnopus androsaceus JB14]